MRSESQPSAEQVFDPSTVLFLRIGIVMRLTGLGRSSLCRMMAEERFPAPVRLANRIIAWRRTDLERWSEAQPQCTN